MVHLPFCRSLAGRGKLPTYQGISKAHLSFVVFFFFFFIQTVLRVWDCMFNEGSKIIFRVALTLIKMNEKELLRCTDFGDMAELFKQITRSSSVLDCHQFIEVVVFQLNNYLISCA